MWIFIIVIFLCVVLYFFKKLLIVLLVFVWIWFLNLSCFWILLDMLWKYFYDCRKFFIWCVVFVLNFKMFGLNLFVWFFFWNFVVVYLCWVLLMIRWLFVFNLNILFILLFFFIINWMFLDVVMLYFDVNWNKLFFNFFVKVG